MTIKLMMRRLPPELMKQLMVAFEAETPLVLQYDNQFIGVNILPEHHPHIEFKEIAGVWSYGVPK